MAEFFSGVWSFIVTTLTNINIFDIIDIIFVAVLVYALIKLIRDTRAAQLLRGIVLVLLLVQVSKLLKLAATEYILNSVLEFGILAIIIIFTPEIRSALERMGRRGFNKFPFIISEDAAVTENKTIEMITNLTRAISHFSATKTGALIVIERETKLGDIMKTGKATRLDCDTTPELVMNIFFNKAPLHDGAMIIRDNRIIAAGCVLPLSASQLDSELGTRHRAGIGVTEVSDAVALIVSEETGIISIAVDGHLNRRLTPDVLPQTLRKLLVNEETGKKDIFASLWKGRSSK